MRVMVGSVVLGGLFVLAVCGSAMGGWSSPEFLSELNGPAGEAAGQPALSPDELSIYFSRNEVSFGHLVIVEQSRGNVEESFGSERVLTELITTGDDVKSPWISRDGLRLYYQERDNDAQFRIKMAERESVGEVWTPAVKTFYELHAGGAKAAEPSLTGDELTIFFQSTRAGSLGSANLWMAIRGSVDEAFGNIRPLYEINTDMYDGQPCVLSGGLTLYYGSHKDANAKYDIFRATRDSLSGAFGSGEVVKVPGYLETEANNSHVTDDESAIYYQLPEGIYVTRWVELVGTLHVDGVNGDDGNDGLSRAGAFRTIGQAVATASDGSEVLVWPGVYHEQVDFDGRRITVENAADAAVVQTDTGYAFSFQRGEQGDSVLRNFVITDSEYGIYLTNGSSPTISNLTIVNNDYGVSAFDGSDPDISNCILWGNRYGDLFECEARYSCVQDGSDGEGNTDTYPLFADLTVGDYHLKSERGRYVALDPGSPPWTAPVHLAELDDGANRASYLSVSADGLRIYFQRYVPSLGHECIVEAWRSAPEGPFGSERVLDELSNGFDVLGPRVSEDGLRLYYRERDASGFPWIKMAQRGSVGEEWAYVKTFDELHVDGAKAAGQSLTSDELTIFFHSSRPGGAGAADLWMAIRSSVQEPFGNLRPLYELNSPVHDTAPYVLSDGLTLYFLSKRAGTYGNIFKSTRASSNDIFGKPIRVELPGYTSIEYYGVNISADEKIFYYTVYGFRIYVCQSVEGRWVLDDVTSPCVDSAEPLLNPAGEPMPNGGRVNMGAYGGTSSASMSEWPVDGDINRDGIVNIADFAMVANDWMGSLPWYDE